MRLSGPLFYSPGHQKVKRLALLLALPLASCFGDTTCRVEYAGQVILDIDGEPVPLQGPYEAWNAFERALGPDCREPDCNVVGDSLFYLQRVGGFDRILSEEGRSLSECDVIVTRACTYDRDRQAGTLTARSECGPDFNLEHFND